jgi:hypothetical protein
MRLGEFEWVVTVHYGRRDPMMDEGRFAVGAPDMEQS